ncbi:NmrA family NAD(P)-binding protein [Nocardioides sp. GXZ039]|uniref:NmrA family NAD(P)-binding protein n=1 Tax=Nocardioides sp. GXZ039 TaxID=3136018 RepID=UPI0030F412E5
MTTQNLPSMHDHRPVLVLGSSGKTGRRVLERLGDRGVPTRAATRHTVPSFSWEDESTWMPVLEGVRAAYVVYSPDLIVPGAVETVARFAAAARAAGVDRLVLLSGRGEDEAQAAEAAVREAGPALTVVRASWFVQNLTEGGFADMVADGVIALPVGDVPEPFVDCDDIADVAVAALLEPGHEGRVYEVTGPRSLTFAELAAEVSVVSGRRVEFARLTMDRAAAGWRTAGMPEVMVGLLTALFGTVFDGRNVTPGDGVPAALGRPARDVGEHLAAAFASVSGTPS